MITSPTDDPHVAQFCCVDCGRHIIVLCGPVTDRCAACTVLPNWFLDHEVARIIDPEHQRKVRMQ